LLRSSNARQLLLQPPPASRVAVEAAVVRSIGVALDSLHSTLPDSPQDRTAGQVLDTLLKHETAKSVGTLAAWVQQPPQQVASGLQQLAGQQQSRRGPFIKLLRQTLLDTDIGLPYNACIWAVSSQVVQWMLGAVCHSSSAAEEHRSSATGSNAVSLTKQLEDSGTCTEPVIDHSAWQGLVLPLPPFQCLLWIICNALDVVLKQPYDCKAHVYILS
jgi:hypothetical protein